MKNIVDINLDINKKILIEASAGTGKTYNLALIFLKLIVEGYCDNNEILVCTFTIAAKDEIKKRIISFLKEGIHIIENNLIYDDKNTEVKNDIRGIIKNSLNKENDINENSIKNRIKYALLSIDNINIYTIDSFLNKIIKDFSFETLNHFDFEIITDETDVKEYCARELGLILNEAKFNYHINQLNNFDKSIFILNLSNEVKIDKKYGFYNKSFLKGNFLLNIYDTYSNYPFKEIYGINNLTYKKIISNLQSKDILNQEVLKDIIEKAYDTYISTKFDKIYSISQNPDEKLSENEIEEINEFNDYLYIIFSYFLDKRIKKYKEDNKLISFGDLKSKVYEILSKEELKENITRNLEKKFKYIVVDECQDTDPVQLEIFDKIFKSSTKIMIGDPKQSIYGFRGADLKSYIKLVDNFKDITEDTDICKSNYRSIPELIDYTNMIFQEEEGFSSFNFKDISYPIVKSGKNPSEFEKDNFYQVLKDKEKMNFLYSEENFVNDNDKRFTPNIDSYFIGVASEINRLITNYEIKLSDIAILVRTNDEADDCKSILRKYGISSVITSNKSIFEKDEAKDFIIILNALINYNKKAYIKAALSLNICNIDFQILKQNEENIEFWDYYFTRFKYFASLLNEKGVLNFIEEFLTEFEVIKNIRNNQVDEKINYQLITNIYHIAEILLDYQFSKNANIYDLYNFLENNIAKSEYEAEIRLESDKDNVKIVSIHKSKGLEYNIVFIPSLGLKKDKNDCSKAIDIHYSSDSHKSKVLPSLNNANKEELQAVKQNEELQENLRLLYVAITRAKYLIYLPIDKDILNNRSKYITSPISFLFQSFNPESKFVKRRNINITLNNVGFINIDKEYDISKKEISKSIDLKNNELYIREIQRKEFVKKRVMSYSSIAHSNNDINDEEDILIKPELFYKKEDVKEIVKKNHYLKIIDKYKGANFGNVFHDIMEKVFIYFDTYSKNTINSDDLDRIIIDSFDCYNENFDRNDLKVFNEFVQEVYSVSLADFKICDFDNVFTELEFYYSVKEFDKKELIENIDKVNPDLKQINCEKVKGFIHGFIDLIIIKNGKYYIIDWKTNFLGDDIEKYDIKYLDDAMVYSNYNIQAYLYSIASDKIFNEKYEFGGVIYYFVRGVFNNKSNGLHYFKEENLKKIEGLIL